MGVSEFVYVYVVFGFMGICPVLSVYECKYMLM